MHMHDVQQTNTNHQPPSCECGQRQIMKHIVDTCPLTLTEGGLNLLHEADDDAVI